MHAALDESPMAKLEAAWRRLPSAAVFSGLTAAWLNGLDVEPCAPIEVTIPKGLGITVRRGMVVRRSALSKGEISICRGFPATTMVRTLLDLSGCLDLTEAVVIADMAIHAGLLKRAALDASLAKYAGTMGISALRLVALHAEPASESPMETRLRMLLVPSGLPRPQAQVEIHDRWGRFIGRPDLYYRDQRLGLEYDGGIHRDKLVDDNRRQNRLADAGVRLLRFTAADIYNSPDSVVALVRGALMSASTRGFARTA